MTKTIPFDKISTLAPGQVVTFKSPLGNVTGTVGDIHEGEVIEIVSLSGRLKVTFRPEHLAEGEFVVEEYQ